MPEQSPTTESKAATTPSVDLFGAGTRVDIHLSVCGAPPSPLVSKCPLLCQLFFHTRPGLSPPPYPIVVWEMCMQPTRRAPDCCCGFLCCVSICHANVFLCSSISTVFFFLVPWLFACAGKLDLPAVSRGPSPLPEPALAGDIVTGEFCCFIFTASLFSTPSSMRRATRQVLFIFLAWYWCLHAHADLYLHMVHATRRWIHSHDAGMLAFSSCLHESLNLYTQAE